jgi:ABC-2 type transport system ATP-binding protein
MSDAIRAEGITKTYKTKTMALRGISLSVQKGEIFCLVGPNGAGKTTLTRILATQLSYDAGELKILGSDLKREVRKIRPHLAVVPQECAPDGDLTAFEHVFYYLRVRGTPKHEARASTDAALSALGLWNRRKERLSTLSGGLRQRTLIAMALATGADLLLLDEPTTGLDPLSRRQTWDMLVGLRSMHTIFITTHSMEEAEALGDHIALMKEGTMIAVGTLAELRAKLPASDKIHISGDVDRARLEEFGRVTTYAGRFVLYPSSRAAITQAVQFAIASRVEVSVSPTTLEDVYISLLSPSVAYEVSSSD